jgi:hypothetical protein
VLLARRGGALTTHPPTHRLAYLVTNRRTNVPVLLALRGGARPAHVYQQHVRRGVVSYHAREHAHGDLLCGARTQQALHHVIVDVVACGDKCSDYNLTSGRATVSRQK